MGIASVIFGVILVVVAIILIVRLFKKDGFCLGTVVASFVILIVIGGAGVAIAWMGIFPIIARASLPRP